ncbi:LysR family transcriptional regulator [Streptomyces huiliensis]|uniref:LysR family transcriptional regulator n=1 Tax=Streptomyces huiliensis TaxID=2876027 RepID=UPI001CC06893|nr:LysR family transcriptional regulator [Streptomyces huiliensis]MBZ4320983.1 LysR family transcriptional regulator [Streptomyces huiliensis]
MLNLERLRTLDAVARHGSVSAAAAELRVTTSAVSQQLAKLERETGERLLARQGRGIRLTDAGRLLAAHAERILSQVALARSDLEAQRGRAVGRLLLGAFPTAVRGMLPAVLTRLRADHPHLVVIAEEMRPEEAVRRVDRGDLDVAVVLDWTNRPLPLPAGLSKAVVLDDPVDVAVPTGHPLAGRRDVSLEDFADDEWVSWPKGEFCHEWLLGTLRAQGVEPRIAHMADEHHTQLVLVAAGLGVVVSPRLGRGSVPDGVRMVPVRQAMRRHVFAVWRADADTRPSVRATVDALRATGRALADREPAGDAPDQEPSV